MNGFNRCLGWLEGLGRVAMFGTEAARSLLLRGTGWRGLLQQIYFIGVKSQSVVLVTGAFTGMVLCAQSYFQFHKVKMDTATLAVVSVAMGSELGPVLTALMVAGRVGAAMAAELGTMRVSEEVEAIEAMGISPLRFLVAPRVLALFSLMPCLSVVSSVAAIIATALISRAYFNIAFIYFNDLVLNALLIRDIITGVMKSFLFGLLISAIACYRGLNVEGGAAGVGTATTSSVVTAITTVIAFDTLFNIVYVVFFP